MLAGEIVDNVPVYWVCVESVERKPTKQPLPLAPPQLPAPAPEKLKARSKSTDSKINKDFVKVRLPQKNRETTKDDTAIRFGQKGGYAPPEKRVVLGGKPRDLSNFDLMVCPRLNAKLSKKTCARRWRKGVIHRQTKARMDDCCECPRGEAVFTELKRDGVVEEESP
jgi:hypothetical protein